MHDVDEGRDGASAETARRPEQDPAPVRRYTYSGRVGEALASATMAPVYRAGRAEDFDPPTRPSAYSWASVALVGLACACLIFVAATGAVWLLAIAVGVALSAAAVAACG